jgi:hypothetical protein
MREGRHGEWGREGHLHQNKRRYSLSGGGNDIEEDAACSNALAEAVKFIYKPGIREESHCLHVLLPCEALPMVEQVRENRKNLNKIPREVKDVPNVQNSRCSQPGLRGSSIGEIASRCNKLILMTRCHSNAFESGRLLISEESIVR